MTGVARMPDLRHARLPHGRIRAAALVLGFCAAASWVTAQTLPKVAGFPEQAIHLLSPFPPGGGNDLHARLVGNELAALTGQPVVIENKAGAGGNIGTKSVAEARPDGYTVLTSQVSIMAVNPVLYKSPGFDAFKHFVPVTQINAAPLVLVVASSSSLKTMADLRALAKEQPGRISYATPGNGTLSHLVGVVLEKDAGIDLTHVPYKGAGPALADLMGGQVQLMITSTSSVAGFIQQGKLRALAVTSPRRVGIFKEVPTLEEAGFKDMIYEDWYAFFAPAGTPPERVAYLHQAITRVLKSPAVSQKIVDAGSEVVAGTPEQLAAQLKQDAARWARVAKLSGATID
ncbi:MAG TPA: tripartite tricarboxylate transporter substrate binding protein [Ideonella sp.]|nr:tripartite tricarboxylate transporter substrate binding protein [Ideonella sp.]